MNGHLKRVLILLLIFTFVFQMAGVTSLSRVQAYADTETAETIDVPEVDEAEDMIAEEIDTESPGEIETDGENPPDVTAEEPADPEAVPEETAEVPEEVPAEETITVEETVEETAEETAEEVAKAEAPALKAATKAVADDTSMTVLAFSSDVHNCYKGSSMGIIRTEDNISAARLGSWIDTVEGKLNDVVDVMAFGGDMANASESATNFWTLTQNDLDMLASRGVEAVLTTGNHEYSPGKINSNNNSTTGQYKINTEGADGDRYKIYCLGSESGSSTYSTSQISALTKYLNDAGNDKPIFIITHFPLHYFNSRETDGAGNVIEALNNAVTNNGQTIIFLWGHNHTMSDGYYDQIYGPGGNDSIQYNSSGNSKTIKFYYGAAGCMSDSEYGGGSAFVKGKGLVATITKNRGNSTIGFTYYDDQGNDVTESDSVRSVSLDIRSTTTYTLADTLEDGQEYLIANGNSGEIYVVSNEATGSGDTSGLAGIAASVVDGKITLSEEDANKTTFTAELKSSQSGATSAWLKNGDNYLYTASSGGLRISSEQTTNSGSTNNTGKFWHYKAEDHLLWYFKDTSNTDGYDDDSNTYKYWLKYNGTDNLIFTSDHTTNTTKSISDFDTPDIYLFVKDTGDAVAVEGINLDPTTATVEEGKTVVLTATVLPEDATNKGITWSTGDSAVATVSNGTVTGIAEGSTTITATTKDGGFTATCTLTVTASSAPKYVLVDSIKDGGDYLIVSANAAGSAYALKNPGITSGSYVSLESTSAATGVTINSGNPTYIRTDDTSIVWTATANSGGAGYYLSNNSNYLRYSSNSRQLRAYSSNTTSEYWTYTSSNNHLTYSNGSRNLRYSSSGYFQTSSSDYKVYIYEKVAQEIPATGISLNKSELSLTTGGSETLTATLTPEGATTSVTWSSVDTNVATVVNGVVTAVGAGTTTITASAGTGVSATCTVTVTEPEPTRYIEVTSFKENKNYIVAVTKNDNTVYALKHNDGTLGSAELTVITEGSNKFVETGNTSLPWTYTYSSSKYRLSNASKYLTINSTSKALETDTAGNYNLTYNSDKQIAMNYPNSTSGNVYYVACNNGTFAATAANASSNAATIRIFEEYTGPVAVTGVTLALESLTLNTGETDTLTATIEPSDATNQNVSWATSNADVATVENGVVTAVGNGTATITVTTEDGEKTATCTVTVSTPVMVDYILTDSLEAGNEYLIATKNSGSGFILSNEAGSVSNSLKGYAVSITADKISITESTATKTVFSCVQNSNSTDPNYVRLTNGGKYLYADNSGALRLADSISDNGKNWHYRAADKYVLWFYNGSDGDYGYTATDVQKYYLQYDANGNFTKGTVTNTNTVSGTDTPKIYLFVKDDGLPYYNVTLPAEGFTGGDKVKQGKTYTFTKSADADNYDYGDVTYTMGGGVSTPITPDESGVYTIANVTGDLVISGTRTPKPATTYVLTDTLKAGDKFIIASSDTAGNDVKMLYRNGTEAASATVTVVEENSEKTITTSNVSATFTAETNSSGFAFKNGNYYFTLEYLSGGINSSTLQFSTDTSSKYWLYSSYQLTCSSSQSPRYLYYSGSNSAFVANTSGSGRYAYVYVEKSDTPHEHTYGEPSYEWTATTDGYTCTATAVCSGCAEGIEGHTVTETVTAAFAESTPATCTATGFGTYAATFQNELFDNQTKDVEIPMVAHTLQHHDAVSATCTSNGNVEYWSCTVCNKNFSDAAGTTELTTVVVPALGHNMTAHAAKAATCTEAGNSAYWSCDRCGKYFSDAEGNTEVAANSWVISATGHNPGEAVHEHEVAATCTTQGGYDEVVYCTVCGAEISHEAKTTPALGHNMTSHAAVVATCTEAGNSAYWSCDRCNKYFSDAEGNTEIEVDSWIIPAAGHVPGTAVHENEVAATCTTAGSYDEVVYCSVCHVELSREAKTVPATGHVWGEVSYTWADDYSKVTASRACTKDPTHVETEEATTTYAVITEPTETTAGVGRYTSEAFENAAFTVQTKDIELPPTGYVVTYEWLQTADGYSVKGTAVPNDHGAETIVETVGATYAVTKEATCTETGIGTWTSAAFTNSQFAVQTKEVTIPASDHNMTHHDAVSATCTEAGNVEYWSCPKCNKNFSDEAGTTALETVVVQALGHHMTAHEAVETTCTTDGNSAYWSCDRCNKYFSDADGNTEIEADSWVIAALKHDWNEPTYEWAASYTSVTATRTCKNDSTHVETETVTATGQVSTPATCTQDGVKIWTSAEFTNAAFKVQRTTEALPATGHDWNEPTYVWAADHTSVTATRTCKNDAEHVETDTAAATSEVTKAATCTEAGVRT